MHISHQSESSSRRRTRSSDGLPRGSALAFPTWRLEHVCCWDPFPQAAHSHQAAPVHGLQTESRGPGLSSVIVLGDGLFEPWPVLLRG